MVQVNFGLKEEYMVPLLDSVSTASTMDSIRMVCKLQHGLDGQGVCGCGKGGNSKLGEGVRDQVFRGEVSSKSVGMIV